MERHFGLYSGPLARFVLFEFEKEIHDAIAAHASRPFSRLLVAMHHSISDGWSCGVLKRELLERVRDRNPRVASELPPHPLRPLQNADYSVWQRAWLEGSGELDRQLAFWRRELEDAALVLDLPTDRPRPKARTTRGGEVSFSVGSETCAGVQAMARRIGTTSFMVCLSAWLALLAWPVPTLYLLLLLLLLRLMLLLRSLLSTPVLIAVGEDAAFVAALLLSLLLWAPRRQQHAPECRSRGAHPRRTPGPAARCLQQSS